MKTASNKQLRRTILCALFAGIVAAPFAAQTAYALPIEGTNAATNKTEADISTSGTVMDITGKTAHNILKWENFSIDSGEKVRFDGGHQTRDYLNLVTGEGASNIYGTIEGGRNVYLVNPHGILFAAGSQVNTGALYLSTANPTDIATATNAFKTNGTSPLTASAQMGDVLNLGTVKTSKLYIEGKNVKVLNTDDVKNTAGTAALTGTDVTIRSEETPHIGYDVGNKITRNFTINGGTSSKTVSDYASTTAAHHAASAKSRGWDVKKLNGTEAHTDYDYMRVHDVYELQNMDAIQENHGGAGQDKTIGRYMLANDIAASETKDWTGGFQSIGTSNKVFWGRFDGAGHTITGLNVQPGNAGATEDEDRGMFGYTKQAVIENVSLKDASVSGTKQVGGIVGTADDHSVIRNVSFSGKVQGPGTGNTAGTSIGGIVGKLNFGSSIENAYNEGTVEGNSLVGGIVGFAYQQNTIQNVRNAGKVVGNKNLGGIAGEAGYDTNIWNALQTGTVEQRSGQSDPNVGGVVGFLDDNSTVAHAVWKKGSVTNGSGTLIRNGIGATLQNSTATDVEERDEAQMKLAETYKDWKDGSGKALVATEGGKRAPWRIYDGKTMPLLTAFLRTKHLANREKVYDGTAPTIAGGDHISLDAEKNVGTYHAYSEQYDIIGGAYTVKPKELTLGFTSGTRFDKTYDGGLDTVTRTLTKGQHYNLGGFVGSDGADVELAGAVTGKYADKNAGRDKEVTFQNLALTGTGAKNYTIKKAQGVGTITPKALTLDLVGGTRFDKTYDGNANVTQALAKGTNYTLTGFIGTEGDHLALAAATGTYTDKNAATDKTVTFGGLTLTGTGAGNYTLNKTTLTGIGTIARRALTLGAVAGQTKTYDGTTDADTSKFGAVLNNAIAGDKVTATATGAAYNDKNVVGASRIDYTGVGLAGSDAGNYTLAATTAQGAGTIAKRALTVGEVTAQSKTYDGTTSADTSKFRAALGNLVAGEEGSVAATATGATYNDKNVAAANKVSYTGVALQGTGAGNYSLAAMTAQGAGSITPKELNLALVGGARFDKTYDGNANVTQTLAKGGNYTLTGFVGTEGDHLALAATTGTYTAGKDARTDKEVTFKNLTLTGMGAGNYTLDKTALTGIGTIARRALTLGAVAAQTKTYDGTRAADASKFRAALTGTIAGDNVTAAAAGAAYNNKNVAAANRIDYTGVGLAGADAGNYSLAATTAQGAGTITHRTLTLTAAPHSIVQGEPLPSFTGRAEGFADGEDAAVLGAGDLMFESAVTNTETPGSYGVTGRIGGITDGILGNYRIRQAAGNATAFTIHAAALPGGLLASLVQDAAPRFDFGFGDTVHIYGTARPIRAATLGLYRFAAEEGLEIQGLSL
ncbi:YDG domain-containing protein [Selenomonas sputigena]|uniref:YDG domain-containing protein n=1 Tax=Selenomonas sputigena TaxID=69823 RepID=UPI0022344947|nr:YDG domain-containing protein [Selenomonas sputigena]UZE45618.1 YDG domain-containing protein [Selenomonas sputigena]